MLEWKQIWVPNWTVDDLMHHSYKRKWVSCLVYKLFIFTHRHSVRIIDDHTFVADGKTYMRVKWEGNPKC